MKLARTASLLILAALVSVTSSCTGLMDSVTGREYLDSYGSRGPSSSRPGTLPRAQGYWEGDGVSGTPMIKLVRSEQRAYFYKGGKLVGISPISTGDEAHTTPAGTFRVSQRSRHHKSSLYGVIRDRSTGAVLNSDADTRKDRVPPGAYFDHAPMPYFLRFHGGIGMHQGHLPGYPASHGCVRLPEAMARKFFENAPLGTKVVVQ